ncbi:MAG: hypothetical protein Kow00108_13660 [Calditrichia bacterium]
MKRNTMYMMSALILIFISFIFLPLLASDKNQEKHPQVDDYKDYSCVECHQEATPDIVKSWRSSKHGMMNFACYMCHGDGEESFSVQPQVDRCVGCHSGNEVDFSKTKASSCFDCHQGHSLQFHVAEQE